MHSEPDKNLALIAGEIFNNLRSALDYIAFQIFVAGGSPRGWARTSSATPKISMTQDKHMSCGRVHAEVAALLDRTIIDG